MLVLLGLCAALSLDASDIPPQPLNESRFPQHVVRACNRTQSPSLHAGRQVRFPRSCLALGTASNHQIISWNQRDFRDQSRTECPAPSDCQCERVDFALMPFNAFAILISCAARVTVDASWLRHMPLPRTVMIDTNVFDQHAYHFASPTIQKFVDLSKTDDDDLRGIVKAIRLSD